MERQQLNASLRFMDGEKQAGTRLSERRAFSLIEIITVVAIATILMSLIAPAVLTLMESSYLTSGGQILVDQINSARQMAAAKYRSVQVRIIKIPERSSNGYTGIQLWMSRDDVGSPAAVNRIQTLPQSVAIAESTALSGFAGSMDTGKMESGPSTNDDFIAFTVRPDGTVTPIVTMDQAFLTVVTARYAKETNLSNLKNYVMIQINPVTATSIVYRP